MAKTFKITKKTWKTIGAVALSVLVGVGAIFGVAKLSEALDTETKTIHPTYTVGGLKTTDGKYTETTDSIYTKDAFECQGLKITPDFDSNVSYEVFFYDSNEQFLSSSGSKTDFYESNNILAKYARIQITPLEDDKVSWFETSKYANQLKVEVNKDQTFDIEKALSGLQNKAVVLGNGMWNAQTGVFVESSTPFYFFDKIDVTNFTALIIKLKTDSLSSVYSYANNTFSVPLIYDGATGNNINIEYSLVAEVEDFSYVTFNISDYTSVLGCVDIKSVDSFEVFVL